jgi:hypothetical protein
MAENETAKAAEEMRRMKVNALKILQMAKVAPSGRP